MPLLVVRHAHALPRSTWEGDDDSDRPLSAKGRRQAEGLVPLLSGLGPARILSSPAVRCLDTVAPLSAAVGAPVEADDRLAEGSSRAAVDLACSLIERSPAGAAVVLCSHGDVIPELLGAAAAQGVDLGRHPRVEKASVWALDGDAAGFRSARYLPPPAV